MLAIFDEYREPLQFSFLFFRTGDPKTAGSSIPGRLRLKNFQAVLGVRNLLSYAAGSLALFLCS
jgi:hypothetical protein